MTHNHSQSTNNLSGNAKKEAPSLINLPPSLSQPTPICRTKFYVDEASLYSIAEDSREDRQSEITSRAGTISTTSTPISVKADPPFSLRSSPASEWDFDEDNDWGNRNTNNFGNSLVNAAKDSRWFPPTEPSLDVEELSNGQSEDTYPMSVVEPPVFSDPVKGKRRCTRSIVLYASLVCLLLACIVTISVIPLLRKRTSNPTTVAGVAKDEVQSSNAPTPAVPNRETPSPSIYHEPTPAPTAPPTFPEQLNTENERYVYSALALCRHNDLTEVFDLTKEQYKIFSHLVAEEDLEPSISQEELLERWAIMVLYQSLDGELWNDGAQWFMADEDVCMWGEGTISCDSRVNGRAVVTGLHLASNGLKGQIPEELCCLKKLRTLDLSSNNLDGTVPACLNDMNLSSFNLANNPRLNRV